MMESAPKNYRRTYISAGRVWIICLYATVAQLAEHLTCNETVLGSSPSGGFLAIIRFDSSELNKKNKMLLILREGRFNK